MTEAGGIRVKICGITTTADAVGCLDLGADYLGLIFTDSPRRITAVQAADIRAQVPGARFVGVFADAEPQTVLETARRVPLDLIQLHGRESASYCRDLAAGSGLQLIKAVRFDGQAQIAQDRLLDGQELGAFTAVEHFLFDLDKCAAGPAQALLPPLWREASRQRQRGHSIFLAGGLSPANVQEAVRVTDPFGVDVCSGVEKVPGRKDLRAVARFIREAKSGKS